MARIKALNPEEATGKTKELFDTVKTKMGMVPNMMRTLGNSPAVLNAYLGFNAGLSYSSLGGELGELIAVTVANENGCNYCNCAHSFVGGKMGIDEQDINDARNGVSSDPKINAALVFAKEILHTKGAVSNESFENIKAAGYNDAQILEILAQVSLSIFTNYANILADTDIDFPTLAPIAKH
ncbi:putative peroxidase-related enzyme [Chryseobacterium ginsenosidimutans]|uniref:carboxymuconolactone decarboxylase family protein n=1 Tax=Chryseobacterium ginsenosidimutans TaxID=687846 RepID=UPI00216926E5|nr:carboxymuconolactone decarboxylase family protein [Chryseobacterium ginsenosidimutans]MCS3871518.1 putative peroxidase-related enzyme [Chryseobacterium ginsenosidimutans]